MRLKAKIEYRLNALVTSLEHAGFALCTDDHDNFFIENTVSGKLYPVAKDGDLGQYLVAGKPSLEAVVAALVRQADELT